MFIAGRVASIAVAACAFSVWAHDPTGALAGGYAAREQSAEFQGMSFAGDAAAGGGLSGMFWNPAVSAYVPNGLSFEIDGPAIFGNLDVIAGSGTTKLGVPGLASETGNMAKFGFLPSGYAAYRLSPDAVLALSINSPFRLDTDPANRNWVAQTHNRLSKVDDLNVSPSLSFRLSPFLSAGFGLQIDQMKASFQRAVAAVPGAPDVSVDVDGVGVGFTAGLNWMPTAQTSVGLGYRSQIYHNLKGTISIPSSPNPVLAAGNAVETDVTLPNAVTLSLRQGITDRIRLLGTVEWTQWSVLQKLEVTCPTAGVPFCPPSLVASSVREGWQDAWMFALGSEYDATRQLKLRVGAAFELSPMQDPTTRTTVIPDQNRLALSGGLTYAFSDAVSVDLAYSHFWGLGGGTERGQPVPPSPIPEHISGDVQESGDTVAAAIKISFGKP